MDRAMRVITLVKTLARVGRASPRCVYVAGRNAVSRAVEEDVPQSFERVAECRIDSRARLLLARKSSVYGVVVSVLERLAHTLKEPSAALQPPQPLPAHHEVSVVEHSPAVRAKRVRGHVEEGVKERPQVIKPVAQVS